MKGVVCQMSNSPRKKPLIFIGLILFVAIAAVGIVFDFINHSKGAVAIISVAVSFVILAVFLVIEAVMRRRAEKLSEQDSDFDYEEESVPQYNIPADQRFLRHVEAAPVAEDAEQDDGEQWQGDFEDGGFDEELPVPEVQAEPFAGRRGRFGGVFKRREQSDNELSTAITGDDPEFEERRRAMYTQDEGENAQNELTQPEQAVEQYEPQDEQTEQDVEPEPQEDFLRPVMVLGEPRESDDTQAVSDEETAEPAEVEAAEEPAEPVEEQAAAEPEQVAQPVEQEPATGQVAVSDGVRTAVVGQSLDSFFAQMSDEDILYRDCVEVWSADAKPAVLRMMKYIEGIEDKQTQGLFGRECEYINAMLDRMYCFTQLEFIDEMLEPKKYNFAALVKECLKRFSPFFMEKRLGLLWKGLDIDIVIDKRWFIFALTQVIFNSVEFTDEGGKIAISAKRNGDFIDLTVDDSGKGITPEEMPYVFVAGYMGDDSPNEDGRRTGMGLFIARSVIIKMGGDVFAESTPGKGTRITLHLPAGVPENQE